MEDPRSSRRPAKSSFGDVFGRGPKFSSAFSSKSDDYAEIFGGIASSCSIPFLQLPPSVEAYGDGGLIDYSEIFGGSNFGDFAVDYSELFSKRKTAKAKAKANTAESSAAASNGSVAVDEKVGQSSEVFDLSPEDTSKDHGRFSQENEVTASTNHSDVGTEQISMSYHMSGHGSIEDVSGKTHITQLHTVPGYTYIVNSRSSQDGRSDNAPNVQTSDLTYHANVHGHLNDSEQEKTAPLTSSTDNMKTYGADMRINEKVSTTKHAVLEDDTANVKLHSRSSSSYSASSGDIPYSEVGYVSISDINLRTQPSRVPPPSRAPPKIVGKQENTKTHKIQYRIRSSNSQGLQGAAKESSSSSHDVEVDASSAAAAAMKEAMEQAQARLKTAKELMEKKRDTFQSRQKLGHKGANFAERNDVKDHEEETTFIEVTTKKPLPNEIERMKEYSLDELQEVINVDEAARDHEEKERYAIKGGQSQQMSKNDVLKASQILHKSEEVSGEWKTEEQFYELINNDTKFREIKEAFRNEIVERTPKATTKVNKEQEIYSEKAELATALKRRGNVNEPMERDAIEDSSKAYNESLEEKSIEVPKSITEACILKENKAEDFSSSCHQNDIEEFQSTQEVLHSEEELKEPYTGMESSCGDNKMNMEYSDSIDEIYHDVEESNKSPAAEEGCEHVVEEKEVSGTHLRSNSHESETNVKMFSRADILLENENDEKVASDTCQREVEEDDVAFGEACQDEIFEHIRVNDTNKSCNDENRRELGGTSSDINHGESRNLDNLEELFMSVENDLKSDVSQIGSEVKENSHELKLSLDTIGLRLSDKKMNVAKDTCCFDCSQESQLELQQNAKKQDPDQVPSVMECTRQPGYMKGDLAESDHKFFEDGISSESDIQFDGAHVVLQRADNKNLDVQKEYRVEDQNLVNADQEVCQKSQSSSHDCQKMPQTAFTEDPIPDLSEEGKLDSAKTLEREDKKELERKLEEEKEREREREKDRLAVERATHETHERALAEARERAERIAVEKVTAEARQRALVEAREKAEKASAEALEKSLVEKALKEAKLRAERAAVERATAEARERAVEKLLAEKVAAESRQFTEKINTTSRSRKDCEAGVCFRASEKEDREIKLKTSSSDVQYDIRFQSAGSLDVSQRHTNSSSHGEVESPLRCKARLERHQRTIERAAKALAEKNMRDILAQREQAERNRLSESLDADVRRWSTGKEGNLRALLSTLQYILGPESGWQPIPLTDVITAAAVKKAYRRATLYVHPDKLQQRGASIQQKYICEKVFDLLKEAWNRFNSEER